MLCLDTKRGPHSTGIALINSKRVEIIKDIVLPWELLKSEAYSTLSKQEFPMMMGHNRFATKGAITEENSHPFHHKHIILTHNGTVENVWEFELHKKFDTDSEMLAASVAADGIEETYKNIKGGMTLAWWDQKENSFNVITNGQRPFFYSYIRGKKGIVYASEEWILKMACLNRGIALETDYFYLRPHHLATFKTSHKGKVSATIRELTPRPPITPYFADKNKLPFNGADTGTNGSTYDAGWKADLRRQRREAAAKAATRTARTQNWKDDDQTKLPGSPVKVDDSGNVVSFADLVGGTDTDLGYGAAGHLMSEQDFQVTYGDKSCYFCGGPLYFEYPDATIIDSSTGVCSDCSKVAAVNHIHVI